MAITIQDSAELTAVAANVGGVVPIGYNRIFKSVGVHNDTGAPVLLQVWLVPAGGAADATNRLISRSVADGKTDMCPELIGRGLNALGTLKMLGLGMNAGFTSSDSLV